MNAVLERFLLQQHDERMRTRPPSAYAQTSDAKRHAGAMGGLRGKHAPKACCPKGHAYDEANTVVRSDGKKVCRTCHRARLDAARAKRDARREA